MEALALLVALAAIVIAVRADRRARALAADLGNLRPMIEALNLDRRREAAAAEALPPPSDAAQPHEKGGATRRMASGGGSAAAGTVLPAGAPSIPPPPPHAPAAPEPTPTRPVLDLEDLFGRRLPVWAGGAALALAGFFLVRYAIDAGILSPGVRVVLGALFGAALLAGAEVARRLPRRIGDPRVAQALAGAGVATLYACAYLATRLYALIPPSAGFAAMAAVTLLALGLALRHGVSSAVLALLGGFLTPALAGGEGSAAALTAYLAFVTAALVGLSRARGWWWLGPLALLAGFGWGAALLASDLAAPDRTALAFLIAALGLGAAFTAADEAQLPARAEPLRFLPVAGALLALSQLALLVRLGGYSLLDWGLYAFLALALTALAWGPAAQLARFKVERLNPWLPPAALLVALTAFAAWQGASARDFAMVAAGLWLVFAAPALAARAGLPATVQASVAGLAVPLLLWAQLPAAETRVALLALVLAVPSALMAARALRDPGHPLAAAVPALAAALGAMLAAKLLLPVWAVPAAWAASAAGLAFLSRRATGDAPAATGDAPAAHADAARAAGLLAALWAGPGLAMCAVKIAGTLAGEPFLPDMFSGTDDPMLPRNALSDLAVPGALLTLGAWLLAPRRRSDWFAPVAMLAVGLFFLWKAAWGIATPADFVSRGFLERAALTALLAGGAALAGARGLPALGRALLALVAARFVLYDLAIFNPAFTEQRVGAWPLLNLLPLAYGVPAAALLLLGPRLLPANIARLARGLGVVAVVALAALLVRQAFTGSILVGPVSTAESWAYSAAGLVLALALLAWGTRTHDRDLRLASLALTVATTAKVFLLDAAALDGLWRIASFVGAGAALIGIGAFYARRLK